MDTILCIDLQAIGLVFVFHILINTGRAVTRLWSSKLGQVDPHRHAGILQGEVSRLVFFVVGVADEYTGQAIKGELAIRLWILNRLAFSCGL